MSQLPRHDGPIYAPRERSVVWERVMSMLDLVRAMCVVLAALVLAAAGLAATAIAVVAIWWFVSLVFQALGVGS